MADNSSKFRHLGGPTAVSAENHFGKTQLKGSNPAPPTTSNSAYGRDVSPSVTSARVADSDTTRPTVAQVASPTLTPYEEEDDGEVWNYPENRIFLIDRVGTEDSRKTYRKRKENVGENFSQTTNNVTCVKNNIGKAFTESQDERGSGKTCLGETEDSESKDSEYHEEARQQDGEESKRGSLSSSRGLLTHQKHSESRHTTQSEVSEATEDISGRTESEQSCSRSVYDADKKNVQPDEKVSIINDAICARNAWITADDKEDAPDDYSEHAESIPFNINIYLPDKNPSKHLLGKEESVGSEKAQEITGKMETTRSGQPQVPQIQSEQSNGEGEMDETFRTTDLEQSVTKPDHHAEGSRHNDNIVSPTQQPNLHEDDSSSPELHGSKLPPDQTLLADPNHTEGTEREKRGAENNGDLLGQSDGLYSEKLTDDPSPSDSQDKEEDCRNAATEECRSAPKPEDGSASTSEFYGGSPTRPKPPQEPFCKPSPQRMAELDRHVLAAPIQLASFPVFELAQYLLAPTRTEVETVYAIFRWVTCQGYKQGQTTPRPDSEDQKEKEEKKKERDEGEMQTTLPTLATYIQHLHSGRMDYADLFSLVCKHVNIETHTVYGRYRYYVPQPSPQLCRARPSSWSAVLMPGGWGLVDCALGARYWAAEVLCHRRSGTGTGVGGVRGWVADRCQSPSLGVSVGGNPGSRTVSCGNLASPHPNNKHRTDSAASRPGETTESGPSLPPSLQFSPHIFYFLPPPELLVTSHLPDNPCWQLLPHPVSEPDFVTSLLRKPHLHYLGVDLEFPDSLRLSEIREEMDVRWRVKGEGLRRFAFRLFSLGESGGGSPRRELTRHGFLENQHSKGVVNLRLVPPMSGRYVCELYGTYVPTAGNEMNHLCSFDLEFVKTTSTPLKFPHNDRVEWGPGAECVALGLTPVSHTSGCVQVDKGETQILFSFSSPVLLTQKLFSGADEGQGIEIPHSTVNFRDSKSRIKILLRIPDPGDYVLSLYAKEESSPGKCQLVCNYLVLCDSGMPEVVHPFPSLSFNKLGPTKAFFDMNMKLVCPKRSCIVVAPYSGKITFVFRSVEDAELSCDLLHQGEDEGEVTDHADYVQHTCQSGESVFRARLPLAGDYLFHVYGKPGEGEGHKFLLYSALIECAVPNRDCLPLPRVLPEFRSRVQILAPLRRFLISGAVTHFAVRAFKIKAVAVVGQSGVQNFLNEDEEEEDEDKHVDENTRKATEELNMDVKQLDEMNKTGERPEKASTANIRNDFSGEKEASKETAVTNTVNGLSEKNEQTEETHEVTEAGDPYSNHEGHVNKTTHSYDSKHHDSNSRNHDHQPSATKRMTMTREDEVDEDDDETEEEWQVWRCKVKVDREDEGSGVKLCVQTFGSRDSHLICAAEFEVITERNMAAKLHHQHAVWTAAEDSFKVRPDSGHRSDIDDEERQSAYFLDDELYISNPLGDDHSDSDDEDDDDSDSFSQDARDENSDDVAGDVTDSDNEDKATSGSTTAKQDRGKAGGQSAAARKPDGIVPAGKKASSVPARGRSERGGGEGRKFHPRAVYNAPQPSAVRASRQKAALRQRKNMANSAQAAPKKRPKQQERGKETKKDKSPQKEKMPSDLQKAELAVEMIKNKMRKIEETCTNLKNPVSREKTLRNRLWKAIQRREREAINKAVRNYTKGGYPPCPDLAAAERLLHLYQLQDSLIEALKTDDLAAIRHALTEAERHGYAGEMSVECRKAHAMLSPHRHHGKLQLQDVDADISTLREIRSYRSPPDVVHHVMVATLLLLGDHEGLTKTWKRCRKRLHVWGPVRMLSKMDQATADTVHPEIGARARVLLDKGSAEEASKAAPGLLAIYQWADGVLSGVEKLTEADQAYSDGDNNIPPKPASKRRQREIFRQQNSTAASDNNAAKRPGADTPRSKSRDRKPTKDSNRDAKDHRKKGGDYAEEKHLAKADGKTPKESANRQVGDESRKRSRQTRAFQKPATSSTSDSGQEDSNFNNSTKAKSLSRNTLTNTRKPQQPSGDSQSQPPGHHPRPKPSTQNPPKDNPEKRNVVSQANRLPNAGGSSQGISTTLNTSPKGSTQSSTTAPHTEGEELNHAQPIPRPSTVRYEQPQEPLQCLSPHKSPLYRPPNKPKSKPDTAKSRPARPRPKTTPSESLQSTFFFASLVGKAQEEGEVNNNIPLTLKNYMNGQAGQRTGTANRAGAMTHTRIGQEGGQ